MVNAIRALGAHMTDEEVTEFIIGRLAELIVVLLRDHVGTEPQDAQIRADSIAILMTLGNGAAKHGRADLMPQLHGLVRKIANFTPAEAAPTKSTNALDGTMVKRVNYRW
jgi:hypothetical protein